MRKIFLLACLGLAACSSGERVAETNNPAAASNCENVLTPLKERNVYYIGHLIAAMVNSGFSPSQTDCLDTKLTLNCDGELCSVEGKR